ncbi:MAG: hypothetical protein ACRD12_10715 [Acidimicrobiales bacterium]
MVKRPPPIETAPTGVVAKPAAPSASASDACTVIDERSRPVSGADQNASPFAAPRPSTTAGTITTG